MINSTEITSTITKEPKASQAKAGSPKNEIGKATMKMKNNDELIHLLPLQALYLSPLNVRKSKSSNVDDDHLYASILNHGVLQNLIVMPQDEQGKYAVIGGGRRLAALNKLLKNNKVTAMDNIPVKVLSDDEAKTYACELSLTENFSRAAMHPVDEFEAFAQLISEGLKTKEVAARFGVTDKFIKQRMKLSSVLPVILDAFRKGDITLDTVMIYTLADTQTQETTWAYIQESSFKYSDYQLKNMIKNEAMKDDHYLVQFVGKASYKKAGGGITADLFGDDVYFDDPELIRTLATHKLEQLAEEVKTEGWKWTEVKLEKSYDEHSQYHSIKVNGKGDYDSKEVSFSGCIVALDRRGEISYIKGLVKKEDQKELLLLNATGDNKGKSAEQESGKASGTGYSNALNDDLMAQRLLIAQYELMKSPTLAIDTLHFSLCVNALVNDRHVAVPLSFTLNTTRLTPKQGSLADNKALGLTNELREKLNVTWLEKETDKAMFDAFCALDDDSKHQLVAYATALMLKSSLCQHQENRMVERVIEKMNVNWSEYWRPNDESVIKRLSIETMMSIAQPVMPTQWTVQALQLKKKEVVVQINEFINGDMESLTDVQKAHFSQWMPNGFSAK